jgi:hypothetical protein
MRTYKTLLPVASFTLCLSLLMIVSCKKDEAPPAKPKLSFKEATRTVIESDGTIEVKMKLDKGAFEDFSVSYELTGTALDKVTAGTTKAYDYEITSDYLTAKIVKGDSIGIIKLKLLSDLSIEDDETIVISIKTVDSDKIEITRNDDIKITLKQEDGLIILLEWPAPSVSTGQADMDILLRVGQNTSTWDGVLTGSVQENFTGPEFIFIPKIASFPAYGLSYVYYDGTLDPLEFTATFIDLKDGVVEPVSQRQPFKQTYTALNKNKWTDVNSTIVVQTFLKTNGAFTAPSSINVPTSGSRIESTNTFPSTFKKEIGPPSKSDLILQFLNRR